MMTDVYKDWIDFGFEDVVASAENKPASGAYRVQGVWGSTPDGMPGEFMEFRIEADGEMTEVDAVRKLNALYLQACEDQNLTPRIGYGLEDISPNGEVILGS